MGRMSVHGAYECPHFYSLDFCRGECINYMLGKVRKGVQECFSGVARSH